MLVIAVPLLYVVWRRTITRLEKRFPGANAGLEPDADQEATPGQEPAPAR